MNQTGATNNTKGTRSVRKVRSACVRCRNRRIKVRSRWLQSSSDTILMINSVTERYQHAGTVSKSTLHV